MKRLREWIRTCEKEFGTLAWDAFFVTCLLLPWLFGIVCLWMAAFGHLTWTM